VRVSSRRRLGPLLLGPAIALAVWFVLQRTRVGRFIRAAALDRETLGALGVNVNALYTWVFVIASLIRAAKFACCGSFPAIEPMIGKAENAGPKAMIAPMT